MFFRARQPELDPNVVSVAPPTATTVDWGEPRLRIAGFGTPDETIGVEGDWYFDLTKFVSQELVFPEVYGPKQDDGTWPGPFAVPTDVFYIAQDGAEPTADDVDGPDVWIQVDPGGSLVWGPRQIFEVVEGFEDGDVVAWDDSQQRWVNSNVNDLPINFPPEPIVIAEEFWRRFEGTVFYSEPGLPEVGLPFNSIGADGDLYQQRVAATGGGTEFRLLAKQDGQWKSATTVYGSIAFRYLDETAASVTNGPVPVEPDASLLSGTTNLVGWFGLPVFAEPEGLADQFTFVAFWYRDTEVRDTDVLVYRDDYGAWVPVTRTDLVRPVTDELATKADLDGGNAITGTQTITGTDPAERPLTVTGAADQTASLLRVENNAGTARLMVTDAGYVTTENLQPNGGVRIGTAVTYTTNQRWLSIGDRQSAPTTVSSGAIVYAESGQLAVRTPLANVGLTAKRVHTVDVNYDILGVDQGALLLLDGSTNRTFTIPAEATVNFPIGTEIRVGTIGTGHLTIAGAVGATVQGKSLTLNQQYTTGRLTKIAADTWLFSASA